MTLQDNMLVDVGRYLVKPWKEDVNPYAALGVCLVFLLLVWWATDALLIHGRLLKAAEALIPGD
jgi:hypothetical protein